MFLIGFYLLFQRFLADYIRYIVLIHFRAISADSHFRQAYISSKPFTMPTYGFYDVARTATLARRASAIPLPIGQQYARWAPVPAYIRSGSRVFSRSCSARRRRVTPVLPKPRLTVSRFLGARKPCYNKHTGAQSSTPQQAACRAGSMRNSKVENLFGWLAPPPSSLVCLR